MNTVYIFERGILGWQSILGDWKNWPNQAVAWIHKNTPHKAQTLTYFCGPILAAATRTPRARQFAQLLDQYKGWRIIVVAHSEGTATALRALRLSDWPQIAELHLICGACDADFDANGLNFAVSTPRIAKLFVYIAGRDAAMKLENTYLGSLCFGLQTAGQPLGLKGPVNMTGFVGNKTEIITWPAFGHSTCFEPCEFDSTMRQITHMTRDLSYDRRG